MRCSFRESWRCASRGLIWARANRRSAPRALHREDGLSFDDAQAGGLGTGLAARGDPELAQDGGDVVGGRLLGHEEAARDLAVAQPLGHERYDLELARRQPGGVLARGGPRPAADVARAALAKRARDAAGGRVGAE